MKEERYKRIEGDYMITGAIYKDENGEIIMQSKYGRKLNWFERIIVKMAAGGLKSFKDYKGDVEYTKMRNIFKWIYDNPHIVSIFLLIGVCVYKISKGMFA